MWKSVNVLKLESKMVYETVFSILIGRTLKKNFQNSDKSEF